MCVKLFRGLPIKIFATFLITLLLVLLHSKNAQAELSLQECLDRSYLITFPIILRNSDVEDFSCIRGRRIGCIEKSVHKSHAENVLNTCGLLEEADELVEMPLNKAVRNLEKKNFSLIFGTFALNQFKATPFCESKRTAILSLPTSIIEQLQRRYIGYSYDYFTCRSCEITGNTEDHEEINLLVSTSRHVGIQTNIKIGVVLPCTGPYAALGWDIHKGVEIAHKMKPFLFGKKIELYWMDHGSDEKEAARAVEDLIVKERVCGIIGGATNSFSMATAEACDRFQVPVIIPAASDPLITSEYKSAFNICPTASFEAELAAIHAFTQLNAKRASIIIDTKRDPSEEMAKSFSEAFLALGGEIEPPLSIISDMNILSQLMSIKAKRPEVVYAPIFQEEGVIVSELAKKLGIIDIPIIFSSFAKPSPDMGVLEKAIYFSRFHPMSAKTKFAKNYLSYFEETTGKKVGELSALGADAYLVLLDAINRANSTEPSMIIEALGYTRAFGGITGRINIVEDRNTIKDVPVIKLEEGKFETITIMPESKIMPIRMIEQPPYPIPKQPEKTRLPTETIPYQKRKESYQGVKKPDQEIIQQRQELRKAFPREQNDAPRQEANEKPPQNTLPLKSLKPTVEQNLDNESRP